MMKIASDSNNYRCIHCGQEWRPALYSLSQIQNRFQQLYDNEQEIADDYFKKIDYHKYLTGKY